MRRSLKHLFIIGLLLVLAIKITLTTFAAQSQVPGNHFSTAKADLFLYKNVSLGPDANNLAHTIPGYTFDKIVPGWSIVQPIKLYNAGSIPLKTLLSAEELVPADSLDLASQIKVLVSAWDDKNHNGSWEVGETSTNYGAEQSLRAWLNQPFDLGSIAMNETKPVVLSFRVSDLENSMQNASTAFNFNFDATVPTSGAH